MSLKPRKKKPSDSTVSTPSSSSFLVVGLERYFQVLKRTALRTRCSFGEAAKVWKESWLNSFKLIFLEVGSSLIPLSNGCRVMSGCVFLAIQPFRWVETSRRATYSMWLDVWRREKTIPPDVPESWIHITIILYTNICRKRIPDHMLRLNRILTHPFQNFSWVRMHGYLVVRCFGFLLGERENVESFVPEFRCHCIQQALSLTDSCVSFHPTDAHAQIHITVYATCIHRYTDIQIYIYIYIHIHLY